MTLRVESRFTSIGHRGVVDEDTAREGDVARGVDSTPVLHPHKTSSTQTQSKQSMHRFEQAVYAPDSGEKEGFPA
jgi:hypothetical protein